jgi:hypothetical protein
MAWIIIARRQEKKAKDWILVAHKEEKWITNNNSL